MVPAAGNGSRQTRLGRLPRGEATYEQDHADVQPCPDPRRESVLYASRLDLQGKSVVNVGDAEGACRVGYHELGAGLRRGAHSADVDLSQDGAAGSGHCSGGRIGKELPQFPVRSYDSWRTLSRSGRLRAQQGVSVFRRQGWSSQRHLGTSPPRHAQLPDRPTLRFLTLLRDVTSAVRGPAILGQ